MPFVGIKQLENITVPLPVMDARVSFDDQFVGSILIHVDSVEHVKSIKVNSQFFDKIIHVVFRGKKYMSVLPSKKVFSGRHEARSCSN